MCQFSVFRIFLIRENSGGSRLVPYQLQESLEGSYNQGPSSRIQQIKWHDTYWSHQLHCLSLYTYFILKSNQINPTFIRNVFLCISVETLIITIFDHKLCFFQVMTRVIMRYMRITNNEVACDMKRVAKF